MSACLYRLPDGSNDTPDENGQHTATVNVLHNAEQYKRFPGCEQCRLCAELDQHAQHSGTVYSGWDDSLQDFTSSRPFTTFTPGCPVCERSRPC